MNGKNLYGAILLIILGVFIAFASIKTNTNNEISPDELHKAIIENTRYYSPEEVAQFIISQDPSLQLIDLRDANLYSRFTLKGAINIPIKDFLNQDNLDYLDQDIYKTVLFSNGTSDADIAWVLATRLGYKNVYVMKGGLNAWIENILQPKENSVVWDRVNDQMYQYRRGASEYFGGKSSAPADDGATVKPKKAIKRHKKKEVEGGCG